MQHATMQLFACSIQLATKTITTAIKLATLQQNGRVPPARWLSITDQLRRILHFLSFYFSEILRKFQRNKKCETRYCCKHKLREKWTKNLTTCLICIV